MIRFLGPTTDKSPAPHPPSFFFSRALYLSGCRQSPLASGERRYRQVDSLVGDCSSVGARKAERIGRVPREILRTSAYLRIICVILRRSYRKRLGTFVGAPAPGARCISSTCIMSTYEHDKMQFDVSKILHGSPIRKIANPSDGKIDSYVISKNPIK